MVHAGQRGVRTRMKRYLIGLLVYPIASGSLAIGPEMMDYQAVGPLGKSTTLSYVSDGVPGTAGAAIYGSKRFLSHSFCWETESAFVCGREKGRNAEVFYRRAGENKDDIQVARSILGKRIKQINNRDYFICQKGCSNSPFTLIYPSYYSD